MASSSSLERWLADSSDGWPIGCFPIECGRDAVCRFSIRYEGFPKEGLKISTSKRSSIAKIFFFLILFFPSSFFLFLFLSSASAL